jgi:hypothetical protein
MKTTCCFSFYDYLISFFLLFKESALYTQWTFRNVHIYQACFLSTFIIYGPLFRWINLKFIRFSWSTSCISTFAILEIFYTANEPFNFNWLKFPEFSFVTIENQSFPEATDWIILVQSRYNMKINLSVVFPTTLGTSTMGCCNDMSCILRPWNKSPCTIQYTYPLNMY